MHTDTVFIYLKKHGQLLDSEIALGTGLSLENVHQSIAELSAAGDISRCTTTSFVDGKPIQGFQCRVAGYIPKPAPGRKPAAGKDKSIA